MEESHDGVCIVILDGWNIIDLEEENSKDKQ